MITWGGSALSVVAGSWKPYQGDNVLVETKLLPDPANISAVCTVLQQSGRERYRVKARLMFASIAAYNTFRADKDNGTGRTLNDGTINATYCIEALSPPSAPYAGGPIAADVVFVEG